MDRASPDFHRRSLRLADYDYGQEGAYAITLCVEGRECIFGEVREEAVALSAVGAIVVEEWMRTPLLRKEIVLDEFVVMPNHFHAIVFILDKIADLGSGRSIASVGAHGGAPSMNLHRKPHTIGSLIAGFKAASTKRINLLRGAVGQRLWQRNYYEHVIRDERDLFNERQYIRNNPLNWELDEYYVRIG